MIIIIDLDGVIVENLPGKYKYDKFGKPIPEMVNKIQEWYDKDYVLKINTVRLNPFPFGNHKPDKNVLNDKTYMAIKELLIKNRIYHCFSEISGWKAYGDYYIDDKGIRYMPRKVKWSLYGDL